MTQEFAKGAYLSTGEREPASQAVDRTSGRGRGRPLSPEEVDKAEERAWTETACTCGARKIAPKHSNRCAKWSALKAVTAPASEESR